jgi:hypothetical protein
MCASVALAQTADRSMALGPNGTLYTVESVAGDADASASARYLTLTIQSGPNQIRTNVPATLNNGGVNWQPEVAIDADSNTVLIFWLHSRGSNLADSELLFCTFQNGKWNDPTPVDTTSHHYRYNMRIGVTRTVDTIDDDGKTISLDGLTVHAAWWDEQIGGPETARYAMLTVERGNVTAITERDLVDFVNRANMRYSTVDKATAEVLRHPIVSESSDHDTVDIVFGDMQMNLVHRVTLKPVLDAGRIRIPIGVREATFPAPRHRMTTDTARLSSISTTPERMALYYRSDNVLRYLTFEKGSWSENGVNLSSDVTAEAAVAALRKMVSGD